MIGPQRGNQQFAAMQQGLLRIEQPRLIGVDIAKVVVALGDNGIALAQGLLLNLDRTQHDALGVGIATDLAINVPQIVQAFRHAEIVGPERPLANLQHAQMQRLGLGIAVQVVQDRRQVVHREQGRRALGAVKFLVQLPFSFVQLRRLVELSKLGTGVGQHAERGAEQLGASVGMPLADFQQLAGRSFRLAILPLLQLMEVRLP